MSFEWAPPEVRETLIAEHLDEIRSVDPDQARLREISLIQETIAQLPSDDFATRYCLETRIDDLRSDLHDSLEDELDEAADRWAERAARKGEHEGDQAIVEAIVQTSPIEG